MADPERYLTATALERELPFGPADLQIDDTTEDADGNTAWDNLLLDVLERESSRIEGWADTTFATLEETESFGRPEHVPQRDLPLPDRPVQSVASVTVDGTALTEAEDYAIEATHLVLLDGASIRSWPTGYRPVDVTWTYGHDGVPGPVEDGLVRLCRNAVERVQTDGLESESTGDGASYNYRLPTAVQNEVQAVISDYSSPSYYSGAQVI